MLAGLLIALVASGTALAANYSLNKTFPGKIVVNPTATPTPTPTGTPVTLYTDSTCSTPIPSPFTLDFGSVTAGAGTVVKKPLYFKTAEVNKDTVAVSCTPATYALTITRPIVVVGNTGFLEFNLNTAGLAAGSYTFSITVTGSGP